MRYPRVIPSVLASLLIVSSAPAQTSDAPTANNLNAGSEIAAARSQYTQTPEIPDANDDTIVAQLPRRGPRTPFPPQRGYPRGTYQTPWMEHGNAGPAVIGAVIGFGVGAAIGACGSDRSGTTLEGRVIIGGTILSVIGGAIGAAHGGPHPFARRRRVYRPSWPEGDEESDLRSHSKERDAGQSVSTRQAFPRQSTGIEATAPPSSEARAVP
jgi:hypothetical protein